MIRHYIATGLGGALGAMLRIWLTTILPLSILGIPFPIMMINITGSFFIGVLTGMFEYWYSVDNLKYFLIPGFLGGFTTFSSFSLEFGVLFQKNAISLAFIYVFLSVFSSLIAFFIGFKVSTMS